MKANVAKRVITLYVFGLASLGLFVIITQVQAWDTVRPLLELFGLIAIVVGPFVWAVYALKEAGEWPE